MEHIDVRDRDRKGWATCRPARAPPPTWPGLSETDEPLPCPASRQDCPGSRPDPPVHLSDGPERHHLESLMAFWSLLADLSFSDLLLFAPVTRDRGEGNEVHANPGRPGPRALTTAGPSSSSGRYGPRRARPCTRLTWSARFSPPRASRTWSRLTKPGRSSAPSSQASPPTRSCVSPTSPWVTEARFSACSAASGRHGRPGGGARWNGSTSTCSSGCRSWSQMACFLSSAAPPQPRRRRGWVTA